VNKEQLIQRIDALLAVRSSGDLQQAQHVFQGALSLMSAVYGPTSPQTRHVENTPRNENMSGGAQSAHLSMAAKGALQSLRGEVEAGLLGGIRTEIAGAVIASFLALARTTLDEPGDNPKNVAAVLVAAAYEDVIRRMGTELAGITDRRTLADVLAEVKRLGHLKDAQFTIAQGYLKFRNDALHADWQKLERASVVSVIGFVEQLIMKHFS